MVSRTYFLGHNMLLPANEHKENIDGKDAIFTKIITTSNIFSPAKIVRVTNSKLLIRDSNIV